MNFNYQIKKICESEKINLREFSDLTGIPYKTVRDYSSGARSPSMGNLQKIAAVPQLAKYRHLLLDTDAPKNPEGLNSEIDFLVQQMKNEGRENEAISILRYVLKQPAADK